MRQIIIRMADPPWMVLALLCVLPVAQTIGQEMGAGSGPAFVGGERISVADYASIQAAIDANPGQSIYVPPGDYLLENTLIISADNTSLEGPGRLIQNSPLTSIVRVEGAKFVRVAGLTLTRPADNPETTQEGITVRDSRFVELDGLRVIDNRGPAGSIRVMKSPDCSVHDCLIYNYMIITVEDRTGSDLYGFAFKSIDGTGIVVMQSPGILIANNKVYEENIVATPELQKQFDLGKVIKRNPRRGTAMSEEQWEQEYIESNWQQGSGIYVGGSSGQVLGNRIKNAAQGMDIHSDNIIVANNIVEDALMGMKAMHGARNVLITGNQFLKPALWGVSLMSGTSSHPAQAATADESAHEANLDGGSIISNNIIADFGYGAASWNWADNPRSSAIHLSWNDGTPLKDVVVEGNVVYDLGRDKVIVDGEPRVVPPRYRYAVMIEGENPSGLHFGNNVLHPGSEGESNMALPK